MSLTARSTKATRGVLDFGSSYEAPGIRAKFEAESAPMETIRLF